MQEMEHGLNSAEAFKRLRRFALAAGILALCFAIPLWNLIGFAATSEFHSYILLIPFISAYLVWTKWRTLPLDFWPARLIGGILLATGMMVILAYWLLLRSHGNLVEDDYLALMMIAFLLCFLGVCCLFWGKDTLYATAFPLGLLIFMVPIPTFVMPLIDSFLQNGSAVAAQGFFSLSRTPFLRSGLVFQLPDISIQVAPECSGIQSSLVLLITGLMASYLFLRTPWKRALLILFMIPLGLLRNGFRVFTIGELCVHIGPQMINSYIHRKGGPIFFVLSLIPLIILLIVLQRSEKGGGKGNLKTSKTNHA
ncbi:MAG TPA: archaeosortase/exosortase family protein [Candidatus Aquilonibacter sp.]|nr:archaeosortase/exosortase family protein [Candidatus Aquilonibacter sp.]